MPYQSKSQRILDQAEKVRRLFPNSPTLLDLLGSEASNLEPLAARSKARSFAENLILVASNAEASRLLEQDRIGGQAFLTACMIQLPSLMLSAQSQEAFLEEGISLPFAELAGWILERIAD